MKAFQNSQKTKKLKIVEVVTLLGLVSSVVYDFLLAQFQPGKSLNYGETLLVRNLDNDFENIENWLAIAMDKGTVEIPDWRSQLDSGQFTIIIT